MPEHTIRLRAGWTCLDSEGKHGPWKLTLPSILPTFPEGLCRLQLIRTFQTPPIDPDREALFLTLAEVPGLIRVLLNGQTLNVGTIGRTERLVPIDLPPNSRNRLSLDVDLASKAGSPADGLPWGVVALRIRNQSEAEPCPPD